MAMVILVLNNAAHTKWGGQRKSQKEKAQCRENERSVNRVSPRDELCTSTHSRWRTIIDHPCNDRLVTPVAELNVSMHQELAVNTQCQKLP